MDVILRTDVAHLGTAGTIVKVKTGYGRNYLIPQGLAYLATEANRRRLTAEVRSREAREEAETTRAQELADQLSTASLTFSAKVGEGERLFGSITNADIAEKLAELGHVIDRRSVELDEPIKALGIYKVPVRLHSSVRAEIRVWVVKE